MALLTIQTINEAGATLTTVTPTATTGDTVATSTGDVCVRITNGSASPITVTSTAVTPCSHGFTHNLSISVAAGAIKDIYLPAYLTASATGLATVICSSVTSVTISAYKVALRRN